MTRTERQNLPLRRCLLPALIASLTFAMPGRADDQLVLQFATDVNGAPFACGQSYAGIGTAATTITPTDLRFYISSVALLDANDKAVPLALEQDGVWQYQDVALLDFEDGSGPCQNGNAPTNHVVRGTVPAGDYTGLEFTLGLPFALNHADNLLAASPLNLSAMFWNWQGGYRFFKLDLAVAPGTAMGGGMGSGMGSGMAGGMQGGMMKRDNPEAGAGHGNGGFLVHLGSTGCASAATTTAPAAACANPNRVTVTLSDFDATADTVVVDVAALLQFSDVSVNTPDTSPGCMSGPNDPECAGIFRGFGLDGSGQKLFRVK
ncbi:MAG: MbnP family copper-binding protein [Pseudohongiellaceae bacterium]